MKLSRRSLFSLALAAPAAAAAVPAKAAEPPITMRPTPECCRLPMVCIERWENARCARYRCVKCGRVAMISDLSLECSIEPQQPPRPAAPDPAAPDPAYRFEWKGWPAAVEREAAVEKFRRLR